MIKWIVILLIVSVIAGALGYSRVSNGASRIAAIMIGILLAFVAAVLLLFYWAGGGVL